MSLSWNKTSPMLKSILKEPKMSCLTYSSQEDNNSRTELLNYKITKLLTGKLSLKLTSLDNKIMLLMKPKSKTWMLLLLPLMKPFNYSPPSPIHHLLKSKSSRIRLKRSNPKLRLRVLSLLWSRLLSILLPLKTSATKISLDQSFKLSTNSEMLLLINLMK